MNNKIKISVRKHHVQWLLLQLKKLCVKVATLHFWNAWNIFSSICWLFLHLARNLETSGMCKWKCLSIQTCACRWYSIFVKGGSTVSTTGFIPLPDCFRTRDRKTRSFFKYLAVVRTSNLNCNHSRFQCNCIRKSKHFYSAPHFEAHNFLTVDKTVFQNSRGFSVECKNILKPKFLYNNRKNQFVGCDDIMSLHFNEKFNFCLSWPQNRLWSRFLEDRRQLQFSTHLSHLNQSDCTKLSKNLHNSVK